MSFFSKTLNCRGWNPNNYYFNEKDCRIKNSIIIIKIHLGAKYIAPK